MQTLTEALRRILDHIDALLNQATFQEQAVRTSSLSNPSGSPLDSVERLAEAFGRLSQGVVPNEVSAAHAKVTANLLRLIVDSDSVDSEIVAKAARAYQHLMPR
jgi:hypothetical protein